MYLPGRHESVDPDGYRYGFNGMELDDEIKGTGDSYDFGARLYDSRIGRWFAPDPFEYKMPNYTTYGYSLNNPISYIDHAGKFPVWIHYLMTYQLLTNAGIDKKTAHEIAHYASTYADHPDKTFLAINQVLAYNNNYDGNRLTYREELGPYDDRIGNSKATLLSSQSDELVVAVSIHAMRTYWEDISSEEAINRALFGGEATNKDGSTIIIVGAWEIVNSLRGLVLQDLTKDQKKLLGLAIHTIQDATIHKGGRWVDKHKVEAEKLGYESEHPDYYEAIMTTFFKTKEGKEAKVATDALINRLLYPDTKKPKQEIPEVKIDNTSVKRRKLQSPKNN